MNGGVIKVMFCLVVGLISSLSKAQGGEGVITYIYVGMQNKIRLDSSININSDFDIIIGGYSMPGKADEDDDKMLIITPPKETPLGEQDVYIKNDDNYIEIGRALVVNPQNKMYFVTADPLDRADIFSIFIDNVTRGINTINLDYIPRGGIFDVSQLTNNLLKIDAPTNRSTKIIGRAAGSICGRWITQMNIKDLSSIEKIALASQVADTDFVVNPTTATFPNLLKGIRLEYAPRSQVEIENFNNAQWISTNLFEIRNGKLKKKSNYESYDGKGTVIYILDTLDGKTWKDNYRSKMKIEYGEQKIDLKVDGHGVGIVQVISRIAPKAELRPVNVCYADQGRSCDMMKIVNSLCLIRDYAIDHPQKKIILNFSLGSVGKADIIGGALIDVAKSGVAISMSHGNDDSCEEMYGNILGARCYQFPVDSIYSTDGIYVTTSSVPAKMTGAQYVYNEASFNRGKSGGIPASQPNIMAPGAFFMNGTPRIGSSYAAAITSAMLSLWSQCHQSKQWPSASSMTSEYFGQNAITINGAAVLSMCQ